ncbi:MULTISPECIES: M10 family metallopeptidase [unclassified Bradyrhizobium]|uniref:M10 family metallopeptidase n=1 Tax=unclassified Bradyrhizobium TaxID=2631580 RepID=UPI003396A37E
MATTVTVSRTNNADIDGLLSGYKWSGAITYSFPDSSSDYANPYSGGSSEPTTSGFASAPTQMQAAINYAIGLILGYTNANIQYAGTNGADIMIAQSPAANPTSYAYYPGNYAAGGDVWFGSAYNYSLAALGNYYFTTALHELGHALGLKHSQETGGVANVAVPSAHDDSEYTVMSYRSYVGGPLTGYTNEAYGYPQTYMANDILALQTLYGANYTTHNENTIYTWSPTTGQEFVNGVGQLAPGGGVGGSANRIYETVWDGGGVDTYDLSNYTANLSINLTPGASSVFSTAQLAYLGNGHYASGDVYNAYLYNNDPRSYIDNAIGGSGNDTIIGNAIANALSGGGGNDTITGAGGNDTINGGAGTDTAVYSGNQTNYAISYNASTQTFAIADQRAGSPDSTDTVTGVENFQFADGTVASSTFVSLETVFHQDLNNDHHPNDLTYAGTATGYNHFIDLVNFEASFPDLISAFGLNQSAMQNWYNQREPVEQRIATFDGLDYIASYPDLVVAFGNSGSMAAVEDAGAAHYIQRGTSENRQTTFNGLDYIASYQDLIKAFGANGDAGAFHFIENGSNEHRTVTFDGLDYIASYPDLIRAFGANEQIGAVHFIQNGLSEHRTTTFDGLSYIAQYPDLMKAFGANNDTGATHYINGGFNEGRTTSFDVAAYQQAHPDLIGAYATSDQFLIAYINHYVATGQYLT